MNAVKALPIYSAFALVFWVGLTLTIFPAVRQALTGLLIPSPASNQSHLPGLDALRGIAALFVAVFHTWQWTAPAFNDALEWARFITKGDKAVPLFVSLSGLLIYRSLTSASNFDDLRRYASRRFLRVFPVYIATVCVAFAFISPTLTKFSFSYFIGEAFMLRSVGLAAFVNPTAWSLYVEILFYLVAPMFVIIASSRPVLWAIGAFLVLSIGDAIGPRELALWKFFACGIIAAEIIRRWSPSARTATAVALVGLCVILYDMHAQNDWILNLLGGGRFTFSAAQPAYTFSLCAGVVLLLTGSVKSPLFCSVLEAAPLRILGAISYSLFMWHSFLIAANFPISFTGTGAVATTGAMPHVDGAAMILIVTPALIAVAVVSYVSLERPFLIRRRNKQAAISSDMERAAPASSH